MAKGKFSLNLEVTTQPESFHSVKLGVSMHDIEIESDNEGDLKEILKKKQEFLQEILLQGKELALVNKIHSSEANLHTNNDENITLRINNDKQDTKNEALEDIFGDDVDSDEEDLTDAILSWDGDELEDDSAVIIDFFGNDEDDEDDGLDI
jgi:hypothetical protein